MRVVLGPLSSSAVAAWARNARDVLELVAAGEVPLPFRVPDEAVGPAMAYVAEWLAQAEADGSSRSSGGGRFTWEGDVDADLALGLVRYWHNLGRAMLERAEAGDGDLPDPEAEVFADELLKTLLVVLSAEGRLDPFTAERMWDSWPRLPRTSPPGAF